MSLGRWVLPLYVFIFACFFPSLGRGHDPDNAPKGKGAERREVRIPIRDFILRDQSGEPFVFRSLRGKVAVVGFAYTTCPDVCPLLTAAMRQVQDGLDRGERERIFLLTVTTDPEIDSPEVLENYAKRYRADTSSWKFLTGDRAELEKVWKNFGVGVVKKARGLIDHTALIAVVDPAGIMRVAFVGTAPNHQSILRDLRKLLQDPKRSGSGSCRMSCAPAHLVPGTHMASLP